MEVITSVQNPKIKMICKLVASNSQRKASGLFVLEGLRLCMDVLRSGRRVEEMYFTKNAYEKNPEDLEKLIAISTSVYEISQVVCDKISDTKNSQGVFCIVSTLDKQLDSNKIDVNGKYILLENVQDPANLGAISRTAEALGVTGLIVSGGCDVYSPKALRASMGALLRLPVITTEDVTKTILTCQENGMKTYASTPDSNALDITKADMQGGIVSVVGNEANGVTEDTQRCCKDRITIRMTGRAESLNAGVAASIIMWEMVKPTYDKC